MKLEIGQRVIVDGSLWDCKSADEYDYTNAEGYVLKLTSGWPLININGESKLIAWEHIKTKEK